jgi:5-guanidino-2-oxopentanoate decarboxylase
MRTVGEALVDLLAARGVDTIFGIPGVHTLALYRGLARNDVRHVLVRHEQGAGFAADGWGRVTGRPGVCFLITGPGVLNAATAIGEALADSVPMLVVTTVNPPDGRGRSRGRLHEIGDQRAALAPIARLVRRIETPEDLAPAVAEAFTALTTGRPGPVVLELPLPVIDAPAVDAAPARATHRPVPAPADVQAAAALLDTARLPVLVAGGGTVDAADAVRRFAEATGAIVLPTTAGKGVIPWDHPCHPGTILKSPGAHALLREADLVVLAGTELGETDTWLDTPLRLSGKVVRIDIDPGQLDADHPAAVGLLGDAGAALDAIAALCRTRRPAPVERVQALRAAYRAGLSPLERKHARVWDVVREALPEDATVCADMTQLAYTGSYWFPASRPRSWLHPVGFGTLGWALPAAIGAKLAAPGRAVLAVLGDGGLQFTLPELGTAMEQRLGLPILLWNNDALGQIALGMRERSIREIGVYQTNPDFQAIARAYRSRAVRPDGPAALGQAIGRALHADHPTLIEVREDDPWLTG